jgi:O-antigen ligase
MLCFVAALNWAQPDVLIARIEEGSQAGLRQTIWRESIDIAKRYPIAGVGAGAYPAAMRYYQSGPRGPRTVFFNHAHNQYIETLTEGGAALTIAILVLIASIVWSAVRGLGADRGSGFWLRAGAVSALAGLAVVCVWESPFRTPATLMLAAVAAGLATQDERG